MPVGGKNNIDRQAVIFQELGISTYFIFDADAKKPEKSTIQSNAALQRLAGVNIVDFPETQAHENWAVFHENIEQELKIIGQENFDSVRNVIAEELGYEKPSKLLKNPEVAEKFINRIYSEGAEIPVLNEIVNWITKLKT